MPADKEIFYRYFIAYILEPDGDYVKQKYTLVHSWESHQVPRLVQFSNGESNVLIIINRIADTGDYYFNNFLAYISPGDDGRVPPPDTYGLREKLQISKGFLTTESAVQFKLYDKPIKFWSSKLLNKIVWNIKSNLYCYCENENKSVFFF